MKTLSYRCEFEAAYIQDGLQSHRYKIEVTVGIDPMVESEYRPGYRIIDYRILGNIVRNNVPDKSFLFGQWSYLDGANSAILDLEDILKSLGVKTIHYSHPLEIEALCETISNNIQSDLDNSGREDVKVLEVKLRETSDSYTTWTMNR